MVQLTDPNTTSNTFRRVSGRMHKAIDSASSAASPAFKQMTNSAHNTVNKMADGAHYAAEALSHKGEQLHHLQQQLTRSTRKQLRSHPLLAIGIVVAGVAVLSWWFSRRNHEHDAD